MFRIGETKMPLYDLNEFLRLSAVLNYQLSAKLIKCESILTTILGRKVLPKKEWNILLDVLRYLDVAYGEKRRRLGPMAILHPLRATALLARAVEQPLLLDLLTEMLHDKLEDLVEQDYPPQVWNDLEKRFQQLLKRVDPEDEWYLMERLDWLTHRKEHETYNMYIGRLVDRSSKTPEILRVKLADRLDNTLDMHIESQDPLDGVDFFCNIFQVLFVKNYPGYQPSLMHPALVSLDGAQRMYSLFKNAVTLSIIQQKGIILQDKVSQILFKSICEASMREAERIVMHIFGYHYNELKKQRDLIFETMDYCWKGGIGSVTPSGHLHRLDGLFLERFNLQRSPERDRRMKELYEDKELMIEGGLAFIVIFLSFLNDPHYYIRGISPGGIKAEASEAPPKSE